MFLRGPTAHVQSDLRDHGQDRIGVQAIHLGQVHAGHGVEVLPHVEGRRRWPGACFVPVGRSSGLPWLLSSKVFKCVSIFSSTSASCSWKKRYVSTACFQREEVVLTPVALQGQGNRCLVVVTPPVPQLANLRGSRSPARMASRIAIPVTPVMSLIDVLELDVHLCQSLLHVLHAPRGRADEGLPLPHEASQDANRVLRPEGAAEQPEGMQLLNPLAIQNVALASRHVLQPAGLDQLDLESPPFQQLEQRNPIDPGGLHGDRRHAALLPASRRWPPGPR